ncbi:MAG: site-specific integrase [Hyphomicrobium sp.]|nr:site-specific integrase [Hyphomicrobium sp.]
MPANMPNPTRRKGSDVYQIRCRVDGKLVNKSLGTADLKEARRRLPAVYAELVAHKPEPPAVNVLSIADVCQRYRDGILDSVRAFRQEHTAGVLAIADKNFQAVDHAKLAAEYREHVKRALNEARNRAIAHDFANQEWLLTYLANKGVGEVTDRTGALMAMARVGVETYREILETDGMLTAPTAPNPAPTSTAPLLSQVAERYITERGAAMSRAVAADFRADVRDLCIVAGDKSVGDYTKQDVRTFKGVLLKLPANWRKRKEFRHLSLTAAADRAEELGTPRQGAKTIQMKRARLSKVFAFAKAEYEGVENPFADKTAWVVADDSAANQRDAFSQEELRTLLASDLRGHLYWLTWLGLCTGARLNELCQLTTDHVVNDEHGPRLYFSPELRLKTGLKESCVRSVPLHPKLLELGFLEYVKGASSYPNRRLFPGLTPRELTGRLSDTPSKNFARHLTILGIKRKGLSYHSLRHSFAAEFKRAAPTDIETRERIMGHAVAGVAGRYGGSYQTEANDAVLFAQRAETMKRLRF